MVRHAIAVAGLTGSPIVRLPDPGDRGRPTPTTPVAHLHFTDRLFGADQRSSAPAVPSSCIRRLACPAVVTLHDVPTATAPRTIDAAPPPTGASPRRSMPSSCRAITSGERLRACGVIAEPTVIPLPIEPIAPVAADRDRSTVAGPMVAVLGFIYPGKGHRAVLEALSTRRDDLALWAVGAVSDGHDDLLGELERFAVRARRRLVVTGYLDDAGLAARHRAGPTSRSSRQPRRRRRRRWRRGSPPVAARLTADSAYARELAAQRARLVTRYRAERCPGAGCGHLAALADPASTVAVGADPRALPRADGRRAALRASTGVWPSRRG